MTRSDGPQASMDTLLRRPGLWLGFGFGGFFDGILLHQVLQWHHLLSSVQGRWAADLRHQVLADGLFHAAMYAVAVTGLVMLLRRRAALPRPGGTRHFTAAFLIGFGAWHATDAVLSHWLFQLHHVRMDAEFPFLWDLGWLVVFGLVPLAAGRWMTPRGGARSTDTPVLLPMALVGGTVLAGVLAALPPSGASSRVVVLADGTPTAAVFSALAGSDARIVSGDRSGRVWQVAGAGTREAWALYRHGALYVSGTMAPAGCAAWLRP